MKYFISEFNMITIVVCNNKSPFGYLNIFLALIHFLRRRLALTDDLRDYELDLGQTFGCTLQLISKKIEAHGIV